MIDERPYDVVVIDFPWLYKNFSDAKNGAAKSAMIVQPKDFLKSIPISKWLAKHAIVLSWFTWPKMIEGECGDVMRAHGLHGVTGAPWIKTLPDKQDISTGIGFWFQSTSEPLTVWKKGNPSQKRYPILGLLAGDERQFYYPASRKHSRKPEDIYDWIEAKCGPPGDGTNGTTRYLELFATRERPGWTCWGSELGYWLDANGVCEIPPCPPEDEIDDEAPIPPDYASV